MNKNCLGFIITNKDDMNAVNFREARTWATDAQCRREWAMSHRNSNPDNRVWRMYYSDGEVKLTQIAGHGLLQ